MAVLYKCHGQALDQLRYYLATTFTWGKLSYDKSDFGLNKHAERSTAGQTNPAFCFLALL